MKGVVYLLPLLIFLFSCAQQNTAIQKIDNTDSVEIRVPFEFHNAYLHFPRTKFQANSSIFILVSGDNKKLIEYSITKDTISRIINCSVLPHKQSVFNFIPLDSGYLFFFNPSYSNSLHDKFISFIDDSTTDFFQYDFDNLNILTLNNKDEIDYYNSTFPLPIRMEPLFLSDSSIIIPCSYDKIPGTTEYAKNYRGQFAQLYPSNSRRTSFFFEPKFTDYMKSGKYFGKYFAEPYGWITEDSIVWAYGINNNIHILNTSSLTIREVEHRSPFIPEIESIDTLTDKWDDLSQYRFLDLIKNNYSSQVFRIVRKPLNGGFLVIVMDQTFEEQSIYELPPDVSYPFIASKKGLYCYAGSNNHKGTTIYKFKEFVFLE